MDMNVWKPQYLTSPVRVVNCNNCVHINITEQDQAVMTIRCAPGHVCNYYGTRVRHETNNLKFNTCIKPCDKCIEDKYVNFKNKMGVGFNPNDVLIEAEYDRNEMPPGCPSDQWSPYSYLKISWEE